MLPRARVLGAGAALTPGLALTRLRVEGTRFVHQDGTPFHWRGATAFDLPSRIALGDLRFLDWLAAEGFTLARIVVATVYRDLPRSLSEGRRQLGPCLEALAARGMYAEVVALCDTGPEPPNFNLTAAQMVDHVEGVGAICEAHPNAIVELFNERDHGTHASIVTDNRFVESLRALITASIPVCLGSSGGGGLPFSYEGDYLTVHTARDIEPEGNGAELAAMQAEHGKPVINDEPQPVSEIPPSRGDRRTDPEYGALLAAAARRHGIAGVTYHFDAGLGADVDRLGPIQREAARRFLAAI